MKPLSKNIVTRFAPSPTGFLHVGGARTALYNYLFARQNGGKFILRIEDTDKARSTKEFEEDILSGLKWLGLNFDEIYRQSERTEIYKKYLKKMVQDGRAYEAEENENKTGKVIRFKNPNIKISWNDLVRDKIEFDTAELKDFVIAKDMETPLYHLAVVVDDFEMGVTHIIRGEDHISNTPRQILIGRAIGALEFSYAHIPLILAPDKSKLSKRHGAVSVNEYKRLGYEPEAIINFLALIGWNPGDEREIFTLKELIKNFRLEKAQKGGAIFNKEKLDWVNKEHIKRLEPTEIRNRSMKYFKEIDVPGEMAEKLYRVIFDRISRFGEIPEMMRGGEFAYFSSTPEYETKNLLWRKNPDKDSTLKHLEKIVEILSVLEDFSEEGVKAAVWQYAEKEGRGEVLWPMRYSLSGKDKSPDPFTLAYVLGKEETLKRINLALLKLKSDA